MEAPDKARPRKATITSVAHPPHPACYPGEEGRSLSQPGVVSSPSGESPSPPNWIFREWRALSVCWRSERRGSALFHCLGTRKLRGKFLPSPERLRADSSSFPGVPSASEREDSPPCEYWIGCRVPTPYACPSSLCLKSPEELRVCVAGRRHGGAVSLCRLPLVRITPFYFWRAIPGPVWGFSSPLGWRDSSPRGVSSFPPLGGKGLLSTRERGCARPRSRLRSWGAPEGGGSYSPLSRAGLGSRVREAAAPDARHWLLWRQRLLESRPVRAAPFGAWGSPRCHLSGSGQSGLPGSQKADGQCQGSARARARLGSAAGPGSSPASAPRSAPLPLPRPPGRRRRRLPARVKEERPLRGDGDARRRPRAAALLAACHPPRCQPPAVCRESPSFAPNTVGSS
ncbi:uncharacterized protein [Equus caballus]|uniref:uncharacterized protein n=1 Tax=Equus caballus TaxID=9796 RepID=UPI0038B37731